MVTVPGRGTADSAARAFYENNKTVIVTAQLVGLCAAAVFVPFAIALQRQSARKGWVARAGLAVAIAAAATSVPVLWLVASAPTARTSLLRHLLSASDLADVVLFLAIAGFGAATAVAARWRWVRVLAFLVVLVCAARSVLLLAGSTLLLVIAPMAFVTFVLLLSAATLARRPLLAPRPVSEAR